MRPIPLKAREYGTKSSPPVVLLHGGPGAAGYMATVARGLADSFHVFEPFQRGSGGEVLTVGRHVEDLHEFLRRRGGHTAPALVGHSWGAMLALAYAAEHPETKSPLVLIGCGSFDPLSRARMQEIREERMDERLKERLKRLSRAHPDPDERLKAMAKLLLPVDSFDLADTGAGLDICDARAYEETWQDMLRLQEEGVYPAAFTSIEVPVLMLHGTMDPHPGTMIRDSLEPYLSRLEFVEFERCGHYPWLERHARDEFFAVLKDWLLRRATFRASN